MQITNIHEAKTHFSKLINRVIAGEEVIIGKAGKPVAKVIPYNQSDEPRRGGQWHGKVKIADDFDELPEELAEAFQGGVVFINGDDSAPSAVRLHAQAVRTDASFAANKRRGYKTRKAGRGTWS